MGCIASRGGELFTQGGVLNRGHLLVLEKVSRQEKGVSITGCTLQSLELFVNGTHSSPCSDSPGLKCSSGTVNF